MRMTGFLGDLPGRIVPFVRARIEWVRSVEVVHPVLLRARSELGVLLLLYV